MTGQARREQLITVGRGVFARRGFEGTTIEEIATVAKVSKPVVYEHFGGKEGLYAVIVDREVTTLLGAIRSALVGPASRRGTVEAAALALLDYIETNPDGFRILVRDTAPGQSGSSFSSILSDIASQVEDILVDDFRIRKLDPKTAPMYAQMLVGMVAFTGQWWLDSRRPKKPEVAAHLVNLAWNGMHGLERRPSIGKGANRGDERG